MGLEGAAISFSGTPAPQRKDEAMKIRERCTCGAEFEVRAKMASHVIHEMVVWRDKHHCNRLLEGWPEEQKAVPA